MDFATERKSGIGGSDAAAVLGISPWKTPLRLFEEKLGLVPDVEQTEPMWFGTHVEPIIADRYAMITGREISVPRMCVHPSHPWMIGHLDRITSDGRVVECKETSKADDWGSPGTDDVPQHYLTQGLHYLAVTGLRYCDFAVRILGRGFQIYTIERDEALIAHLIERERAFWEGNVLAKIAPDPVTIDDARRRWTSAKGKAVPADAQVMAFLRTIKNERAAQKESIAREKGATFGLLTHVADGETLVDPDTGKVVATLKTSQRKAHSVGASVSRPLLFKPAFDASAVIDFEESA